MAADFSIHLLGLIVEPSLASVAILTSGWVHSETCHWRYNVVECGGLSIVFCGDVPGAPFLSPNHALKLNNTFSMS